MGGQCHSETSYGNRSTLGGIFSVIFRMRGRVLMTLITIIYFYSSHDMDGILIVIGSKVKAMDNIFWKCTVPVEVYQMTVHC